jgi:tetratricopeptide (TPR) repeat protein
MAGALSLEALSMDEFEELGRSFVRRMGFDLKSLHRAGEDSFIVVAERVDPDGNVPCVLLFREGEPSLSELQELVSGGRDARKFAVADSFDDETVRYAAQNDLTLIDGSRLEEMLEALGIVHLAYPEKSAERRITDPKELERKVEWALLLYGREEFSKAIGILDDVLRMRPGHREARRYRVECLIRMGEIGRARRDLESLIEKDPKDVDSLFLLSHAHFLEERKEEERACYLKILEIDDKHKEAWLNLGVLLSKDDEDRAILCFRNAAKVDQGDPRPWNNIGVIERRRGDLAAAEEAFATGAKSERATPELLTNLIATRLSQGKLEGSVELAKKLLDMGPRGSDPWLAIGWVFAVNGDEQGAVSALRKAAAWDETIDVDVMLARMTGRPPPERPPPPAEEERDDVVEDEVSMPATKVLRPAMPTAPVKEETPSQEDPDSSDAESSPPPAKRAEDILDEAFAEARRERMKKAGEKEKEDESAEPDAERQAGAPPGPPGKRPEQMIDAAFAAAATAMKKKEARAAARAGLTQALKTAGPKPVAAPSPPAAKAGAGASPVAPASPTPTAPTSPSPETPPAAPTDLDPGTRLLLARALLSRGRAGQAADLLAGDSEPERLLRAAAHEMLGRVAEAEEDLSPLAERGRPAAVAALARLQLERDQPHRALEMLASAKGDSDRFLVLRANALAAVGRFDEAVAEGSKVSARGSVHATWLGSILQRAGRSRDAELRYKEAIESQPLSWIAWNNLGVIAKSQGDPAAARMCFERAAQVRAEPGVQRNFQAAVEAASPGGPQAVSRPSANG